MGHDLDSLPPLDEQNAIMLSAVFDSADPAYGKFSTKYIDLQFRDANEQTVDGCCLGYGLQEKLENIPSGTQMQLLIHPDSGNVLQIKAAGKPCWILTMRRISCGGHRVYSLDLEFDTVFRCAKVMQPSFCH